MNKTRVQIIYSLAILFLIPALLAFNTLLLATEVRQDYDRELQSRAELANSVMAVSVRDYVETDDKVTASERLTQLSESQVELQNITILTRQPDGYEVFSSLDKDFVISTSDTLQFDISYSRKWPVAKNVAAKTLNGADTRAWNVVTPITNDSEQVIGLVSSDYLTTDVDEKFDATLSRSLVIMVISAGAVIVLLLNHFRLISYVGLLKKQKELNQTMGDFLSVATHELKAPMTMIKGYIANVIDGDHGKIPKAAKDQLEVAVNQTDRLNDLVKDLLNVSRIEQGKLSFDIKPVNASEIIKMIVGNYTAVAAKKDLVIKYEPTDDVWLMADAGRVQEIFTNLIDNAVKYSVKGEIMIQHKVDGKKIVTSVRDTGIGMTADERERLFQRFYRVKNEKTKNVSGTGLGLWIIKQYIDKMGGDIKVDSLEGSGTEFRVSLVSANKKIS